MGIWKSLEMLRWTAMSTQFSFRDLFQADNLLGSDQRRITFCHYFNHAIDIIFPAKTTLHMMQSYIFIRQFAHSRFLIHFEV